MHELSVTKGLLETVLKEYDAARMGRILTINLAVGEMYDYEEKWLLYYIKKLTEGTENEAVFTDTALNMEKVPVSFLCGTCGKIFKPEKNAPVCPDCGGSNVRFKTGREFFVKSMEVEE